MSIGSPSGRSDLSVQSSRSRRSGKSLTEKIRELGIIIKPIQPSSYTHKLQIFIVKTEAKCLSDIIVMTPSLNLGQITYYQPELSFNESSLEKSVYRIDKFETNSLGPKVMTRISDIEVKSFKPKKKMTFRKKKRQSSVISKLEEILNRGKDNPTIRRQSSEESIYIEDSETLPKNINDLSENNLQKIFLWLTQKERRLIAARVCKSWYYILQDPIFWKELEFFGNKVQSKVITKLLQRYSTLEKLRLTSVPETIEILQELCRCNHSIRELGVRYCNISNYDFARIIYHVISCCINLEVLDIKGMQFQSEKFYLELGRLKNFRSINLNGNKLLRNQDLITLSVNCRVLSDLRILDTNAESTHGTSLSDNDLIFIISHLQQNIRILKIDMQKLGNISYQAILKCSHLECLVLKNCLLLSGDVFRQFTALEKLKKLKVTRAINVKEEDFHHVFSRGCVQRIEHLDVNGCWNIGEGGFKAIVYSMISLKFLSLKNCKSIMKNDLSKLAFCSKLEGLNVAHTNIDPIHLVNLPQYTPNLSQLTITWNVPKKVIRYLIKVIPSLSIKLSFSEFQKDERILNDL